MLGFRESSKDIRCIGIESRDRGNVEIISISSIRIIEYNSSRTLLCSVRRCSEGTIFKKVNKIDEVILIGNRKVKWFRFL